MSTPVYRVWLGRRIDALRRPGRRQEFIDHLKKTFVPATWQVMGRFGLSAYLPSVMGDEQDPDLPDETALLVYASETRYKEAFDTVAGRAYALLHQSVFTDKDAVHPSHGAWAVAHAATLNADFPAASWPASADGPRFADASSQAVFLVLRHQAGSLPDAQTVQATLGQNDGEVAWCRERQLSFVWLATRGERTAAGIAQGVLAAQPAWAIQAAHDALPCMCDPDGFEPLRSEVVLDSNMTLHFAARPQTVQVSA